MRKQIKQTMNKNVNDKERNGNKKNKKKLKLLEDKKIVQFKLNSLIKLI